MLQAQHEPLFPLVRSSLARLASNPIQSNPQSASYSATFIFLSSSHSLESQSQSFPSHLSPDIFKFILFYFSRSIVSDTRLLIFFSYPWLPTSKREGRIFLSPKRPLGLQTGYFWYVFSLRVLLVAWTRLMSRTHGAWFDSPVWACFLVLDRRSRAASCCSSSRCDIGDFLHLHFHPRPDAVLPENTIRHNTTRHYDSCFLLRML